MPLGPEVLRHEELGDPRRLLGPSADAGGSGRGVAAVACVVKRSARSQAAKGCLGNLPVLLVGLKQGLGNLLD